MSSQLEKYETCAVSPTFVIDNSELSNYRNIIIKSFWNRGEVATEGHLTKDRDELRKLPEAERECILYIHAFFAIGDEFVVSVIQYLLKNVKDSVWLSLEIQKQAQENIHSEVYAALIKYLAPELEQELLGSIGRFNIVKDKITWCEKYLGPMATLLDRHVPLARVVL
jgi:ribonucleotide reductase beta subunit family protein with ferritin-like domain